MDSNPEDTTPDEVEDVRKKVLGRRLGVLFVVLLSLTAYAAVTGSFKKSPKRQGSEILGFRFGLLNFIIPEKHNGFDVSNATIPKSEILRGGPPRDGIPAIDEPKFLPVSKAHFLRDADQVIGLVENGDARAYPLRILVWHEIVNDTVGGRPITVIYCPLCGTGMVFDRRYAGEELTFGVSGLLYNSDVLMYDRQTESLWSQLKMEAVAGPQAGQKMHWLASEQMTWSAWKKRYPDSKVLSTETGYQKNYDSPPYAGYEQTERTIFPVPKHRDELKNKEWVIGVVLEGVSKAYPIAELEKFGSAALADPWGDVSLIISYDAEAQRVEITKRGTGETVPSVRVYWFAWQAFYPQTGLYVYE